MARILIIGCGCRGRALGAELKAAGHAVRGTTRDQANCDALHAVGVEPFLGDPDRIATMTQSFEHVSVACILLGSASGSEDALSALHGTRLEMMLTKLIDTTVRGIVYEAAGTIDPDVLAAGAARVRAACEDSLIPYAVLDADPASPDAWLTAAVAAVDQALSG